MKTRLIYAFSFLLLLFLTATVISCQADDGNADPVQVDPNGNGGGDGDGGGNNNGGNDDGGNNDGGNHSCNISASEMKFGDWILITDSSRHDDFLCYPYEQAKIFYYGHPFKLKGNGEGRDHLFVMLVGRLPEPNTTFSFQMTNIYLNHPEMSQEEQAHIEFYYNDSNNKHISFASVGGTMTMQTNAAGEPSFSFSNVKMKSYDVEGEITMCANQIKC